MKRHRWKQLLLLGVLLSGQASWADDGAFRCASESPWEENLSALSVAVKGSIVAEQREISMKADLYAYVDGSYTVTDDDRGRRLSVIWMDSPQGRLALGSTASAVEELAELSILFELPFSVLRQQFRSPCDLRLNVRYPVKMDSPEYPTWGEIERDGDSIRFDLHRRFGQDLTSAAGHFTYKVGLDALPASLSISGWTIFRGAIRPEAAEPSKFETLGELRESFPQPQ